MTEKALVATWPPITAVSRKGLVSEKSYVEELRSFATVVLLESRESEIAARKLLDHVRKVQNLEHKMQLLADDAGKVGNLQKQLSVKEAELASAKSA